IGQENPPPVFRHSDVAIGGPPLAVDRSGGTQIDIDPAKRRRPHFPPPVEKMRLPLFERALQRAVLTEADIIRNPLVVVDRHALPLGYTRSQSNCALAPLP